MVDVLIARSTQSSDRLKFYMSIENKIEKEKIEHYEAKLHWIGAQFCVCMFLHSRDKSLNMLSLFKFMLKIKVNERTKEEQRERPYCGIHLQCTKRTIWPPNENYKFFCKNLFGRPLALIEESNLTGLVL